MDMIIFLLVSVLIIGVFSAFCARYIDSLMDYGSIFGGVRFKIAMRYAIKNGYDKIANQLCVAAQIQDYHTRLEEVNNLYWKLAGKLQAGKSFSWFTGWICLVCLTSRVNILLWTLTIPIMLKYTPSFIVIFVVLILSLAVSNITVNKL